MLNINEEKIFCIIFAAYRKNCIFTPSNKDKQTISNNQKIIIMKNIEKSSKVNNITTNNDVLSPETIKAQLKAACANMTAKETKEYIKRLAGYELRLTGQKPTQHYTVFYGEVRVCNVEQVQGIKADGTARGCISTAKVNFEDAMRKVMFSKYDKVKENLTEEEDIKILGMFQDIEKLYNEIQCIFDAANERAAAAAAEAAKAKREAAKAAAQKERNRKRAEAATEKLKDSSTDEKLEYIKDTAAALGIDLNTLLNMQAAV